MPMRGPSAGNERTWKVFASSPVASMPYSRARSAFTTTFVVVNSSSALELFTTTKVVVNADLARLYGIDATGLDANTFQVRSLPADGPRIGILLKAGFLSQFANQKEGSPTLRGKFMREALLCTPTQPPPGNVDTVLDDPPPDMPMTKRQRLEQHRNDDT